MHDLDDERLRKLLEVFGRRSDLEPIAELAGIVVLEQRDRPWLAVTHLLL